MMKRFAYDNTKKKCVKFYYGGCKGNQNNFKSMEDCTWTCEQKISKPEPEQDEEDMCSMSIEVGPCKAKIKRFAYDKTKEKCVEFYFGGCKGNQNNFETMEDCTWTCEQKLPKPETEKDVCSQPITTGPCKSSMPRYGYDAKRGKCVKFVYGGCKGNDNRFLTKSGCEQTCMNGSNETQNRGSEDGKYRCSLPIASGPCKGKIRRFAYDTETGKCVRFTYGGC
ncbi:Kunitz/Bovine pancreatic trypsin inhibitor domain protein, partial [Ancylostoma caninum]